MIIVWRGWGFLVPVIGFGCGLAGDILIGQPYGPGAGYIVSSVPIYAVAAFLNKIRKIKTYVDKETGELVEISSAPPSFFFIPMVYWSPIAILLGLSVGLAP